MIIIHYDFTDGTEVSFKEGLTLGDNFKTNCLDFFNMDEKVDEVMVIKKDGSYISRNNINLHTPKEIRQSHDIHKMLVADSFNWF
jgi:hypothetical protein